MREKGFDVPDTGLTPDNLSDTSEAFNNALNECQQEIGPALGEENDLTKDADAQQQLVKGAECLRGLGYDIPDSQSNFYLIRGDVYGLVEACAQQSSGIQFIEASSP